MSGIFVSYRREDAGDQAHRLYRGLCAKFGTDSVFIDVANIGLGDNFSEMIEEKVGFCDCLIAVIGKRWLTCTNAEGQRRLDDPSDWVRLEIAEALSRPDMKVFPVLVGGASLPSSDELPWPLATLAQWQAMEIRHDRFDDDVSRLGEALVLTRRGENIASLWFSIITRGHRALNPLDLHKPGTFRLALGFLLLMLTINAALHWQIMTNIWSPIKYAAGDCVQYLGVGFVFHFAMKAVGGRGTLQRSIAAMCLLTAYVPLIALAQVPSWGLNTSIVSKLATNAVSLDQLFQEMKHFIGVMGAFAMTRLMVAFLVATFLWWRFLRAVYSAFRTLHHLSKPLARKGFALGMAILLPFAFFVVIPFFGVGYTS
jgi:hypothetical protein